MANAEASSSTHHKEKRDKKERKAERKEKKDKKDKKERKALMGGAGVEGPFEHRVQRMRLSVPPKFAADWLEGVRETLNVMLMQYVPEMGGVLLAHWEHEFVDETVKIINECPFGVCEVQFHSIVWAPKVGQVLYGTHSLSSPSHLSLLFAKTFNISIPLQHIPQDIYEFEHTDDVVDEDDEMLSDDEVDADLLTTPSVHEVGRWKETGSGKLLGAERVRFTVIGLQVSNHMLSLTGSLLADPSNPPAAPSAPVRVRSPSPDLPDRPVATKPAKPSAKPTPKKAAAPATASAPATPAIDESKLSERDLKRLRKEQDRAKRDARKARKEAKEGEGEDAEKESGDVAAGVKRKAEDEGGERKKKRKD